jgi:hypothetical protein
MAGAVAAATAETVRAALRVDQQIPAAAAVVVEVERVQETAAQGL